MNTRSEIRFLLNGETIALRDVRPDETLLDFLRLRRSLRGTKEGCAEGDCGACTVLVGRLAGGELVYEGVNACIRFVGSLDGCHVVTVEHLKRPDGTLHPVQQALVDLHGSQCGFCTPGFVMALYGLWMRNPDPSEHEIELALQGNLCRCTGYEPIVKAAKAASGYGRPDADPLVTERETVTSRLREMADGARIEIGSDAGRLIVPADADDFAAALSDNPNATIVAGSTDVGLWVTKHMRAISPAIFIGGIEGLRGVTLADGVLTIGAATSYADALRAVARHVPAWRHLIERIGGDQVRNMGTIGGNIANGSPIGDTPPPLIALGAEVVLRSVEARRSVLLEDFFIEYGKQDRRAGEFVEAIRVKLPPADAIYAVHKVTKRRDEDITAVLGAFAIRLDGNTVAEATIAYGGMAGTPKRARHVEAALRGKSWNADTVEAALPAFEKDFQPLTDMRASAAYRMLVAKNLLRRVLVESSGTRQAVTVRRHEVA
jgi:xanthine dehydrogenase small subunit